MPDEDNTLSGSLVLDLRISWRHLHTLYCSSTAISLLRASFKLKSLFFSLSSKNLFSKREWIIFCNNGNQPQLLFQMTAQELHHCHKCNYPYKNHTWQALLLQIHIHQHNLMPHTPPYQCATLPDQCNHHHPPHTQPHLTLAPFHSQNRHHPFLINLHSCMLLTVITPLHHHGQVHLHHPYPDILKLHNFIQHLSRNNSAQAASGHF